MSVVYTSMVWWDMVSTSPCVGRDGFGHTHHVYASMLAVMDFVVPDDGAAIGSDLDACQCIAIDVIHFNEAPPIAEYVHASLVAVVDGVPPALRMTQPI